MSGLKGQCAECGWTTRRSLKNMNKKPCPKCGGPVYVHEEDRGAAIFVVIAVVVFAVIFAALTGNW
ncbi:DUF983 domain-containing protein [Ruegeria atlantica]|uniref:DUF983 domain-containing protein n=1 Tax=Ruegeria atlantica TaxID=81569 RepID=UPI00147CA3C4|nr:DUF983 domain-containing protein [Ruegeria atlantica]